MLLVQAASLCIACQTALGFDEGGPSGAFKHHKLVRSGMSAASLKLDFLNVI